MSGSAQQPVDLSRSNSSALVRGRPLWFEALWHWLGSPIVQTELLPFSALKVWTLRCFGARVGSGVYVKPLVKVKFPWYLTVGQSSWIGERVWIDNLSPVEIGANVCISQDVYLCTGNHDWSDPHMDLFTRSIVLEDGAWVGARATVFGGVRVGVCGIAIGGSVVARDIGPFEIHRGNPAAFWKTRTIRERSAGEGSGSKK
jgi:putative colanic acid biosynthesis acetyltransferase WcaF